MDIPHTDGNQYFTFNPATFNKGDLEAMKSEIRESERRLVVITDPHIKINAYRYPVYDKGIELDMTRDEYGNLNSIFVKQPDNDF